MEQYNRFLSLALTFLALPLLSLGLARPIRVDGNVSNLRLATLGVTGGGPLLPEFAADVFHYAIRCDKSQPLLVSASTASSGTRLLLNGRLADATPLALASAAHRGQRPGARSSGTGKPDHVARPNHLRSPLPAPQLSRCGDHPERAGSGAGSAAGETLLQRIGSAGSRPVPTTSAGTRTHSAIPTTRPVRTVPATWCCWTSIWWRWPTSARWAAWRQP